MLNILLTAVVGTTILFLGFSFFTYTIFWYETANTSYEADLERLSQGKTKAWILRGVLSSFLSFFPIVLFYPFGFWKKLWHPEPDLACQLPPVILVHGIYHNPGAWMLYRYWLKRSGFKNVYAFSYSSWKSSFEDCLKGLEDLVKEVRTLIPQRKVALVGHSLGGLLSRTCVDLGAREEDIGAVVTLGTPHRGSKMAALGLGRLVKCLAYGGAFIEKVECSTSHRDIPRLSLYSPVDNMVLPNVALRTSCEGWIHQRIAPISHVAMLYHRPTAKHMLETLRNIHV